MVKKPKGRWIRKGNREFWIAAKPTKYRLRFQGTRSTKTAPTIKQARVDARYWLNFGQTKVCIDRQLPSGLFEQVACLMKKRKRSR